MTSEVGALVGWEREVTRDTLARLAPEVGLAIKADFPLSDPPDDLSKGRLLFIEQRDLSATVIARAQAFASAAPDAMLVVLVPDGSPAWLDASLFQAGAFDVCELGPTLARSLGRTTAAARRVLREEQARARLGAELAHRERLSAIGVLAAGVGHEINNPASVVLVSAEHVRSELERLVSMPRYQQLEALQRLAPRWTEDLGDCIAATRRISAIVKTLTVFSRRADDEAGPEPVVLNDEINTVVRLVGKELRYQAAVDLELDPGLPYVLARAHEMTQVVTNLVVNALQALEGTPQGERRMRIRTTHDRESVLLEVADNGPGIPRELLDRIFDPFFTTKEAGKGSGLGLAITRELVRKAGGDIFVESSPERGARFSVVLPRPVRERPRTRPPTQPPPRMSRLRVMIVDDDEFVLRAITRSLSDDFECIALASASEAVDTLRRDARIDALLADIVMPGMNGLELYQAVQREHPQLADRMVFFSGGIRSSDLAEAIARSGRPCLDKPVDAGELERALRDVTNH